MTPPESTFIFLLMFRTAMGIEYDGTDFVGFQSQKDGVGAQTPLENALAEVAGHPVQVFCSGRTDAGVHATQQVIHFDHEQTRDEKAWLRGASILLPASMRILWSRPVSQQFHARFEAKGRKYVYRLLCHRVRPALMSPTWGWECRRLDGESMRLAANLLLGTHDFSGFRSSQCQSHKPVRTLQSLDIEELAMPWHADDAQGFVFHCEADGFLHNMVRILVGTLVEVGKGEHSAEWVLDVLNARDRKLAGKTMPPQGLFYCGARYAENFGLPGYRLPMDLLHPRHV